MKFVLLPLLLMLNFSCVKPRTARASDELNKVNDCWRIKSLECMRKEFGSEIKVSGESLTFSGEGTNTIEVFTDSQKTQIASIWLTLRPARKAERIFKSLHSNDWVKKDLPEKIDHVVNRAISNYSSALEVSFLTFKSDSKQETRVLYWGWDPLSIEF